MKDLAPGIDQGLAGSHPGGLEVLGERILFATEGSAIPEAAGVWAGDPDRKSIELLDPHPEGWRLGRRAVGTTLAYWWTRDISGLDVLLRSDGTAAGTLEIHRSPAIPFHWEDRQLMVPLGDRLLFAGYSEATGWEPWLSDGTPAGTHLLADLYPGQPTSNPHGFTRVGDLACFLFHDHSGIAGLACSDGSTGHLAPVALFPDLEISEVDPVATSERLFFTDTSSPGAQIVTSDGTAAGTRTLTAFPGPYPIHHGPVVHGSTAFFVANDGIHGQELWRSDGTVAGTQRVSDFTSVSPFSGGISRGRVAETGGYIYFCAREGGGTESVWRSQGLPGTTQLVATGGCESAGGFPGNLDSTLTVVEGRLVLIAHRDDVGKELFAVEPGGELTLLSDSCPGPCSGALKPPQWVNGLLSFQPQVALGAWPLLVTDGSPAGTREVASVPGGVISVSSDRPPALAWTGRWLAFVGIDPLHGAELWLSDLDPQSSHLLTDLALGAGSSYPTSIQPLRGGVAFAYCDASGPGWAAAASTAQEVSTLGPLAWSAAPCHQEHQPSRIAVANDHAFVLDGNAPSVLRRGDGTAAGDLALLTVPLGESLGSLTSGGGLAWLLRHRPAGAEIWSSDGTPAGTVLRRVLGSEIAFPGNLTWIEGRLAFTATDSVGAARIWTWNPGDSTLRQLPIDASGLVGDGSATPRFVGWNGGIYFLAGPPHPKTLWRHDVISGATDGVVLVSLPAARLGLGAGATGVYFLDQDPQVTLWRTDGTPEGTAPVRPLSEHDGGLSSAAPPHWTRVGPWLLFRAFTAEHGLELWATDGTSEGTFLLPEVQTGPPSSKPGPPIVAGGDVFYSAEDPRHGVELWRLDATTGALSRLSDIAPGSRSSFPSALVATETHLFFRATDGLHGHELWAMPLDESGCQPSSRTLCLRQGRFQLEAHWRDFTGGSGDGVAVPLTSDTGFFWFFDQANVETVIKVLDALGVNNRFWVYYGALSNVEYSIDVTDTATRVKRRYFNPAGRYASVGDNDAFDPAGGVTAVPTNEVAVPGTDGRPLLLAGFPASAAASGSCAPSETRLCLQQGRFAVEATWRDFQGHTGVGTAVPLSADTGYFWFFADTNVEAILKVLDGRPINDRFWVYYGALSNVEYTITVTDTVTGFARSYFNPAGRYASVGDNDAF